MFATTGPVPQRESPWRSDPTPLRSAGEAPLRWHIARAAAPPTFIAADADFDFAVCRRPSLGFGSGTLYFAPGALHLVTLWCELARRWPNQRDQRLLQRAWETLDSIDAAPRTDWLPETYLRKVDQPGEDAVIVHHQASRDRRS